MNVKDKNKIQSEAEEGEETDDEIKHTFQKHHRC